MKLVKNMVGCVLFFSLMLLTSCGQGKKDFQEIIHNAKMKVYPVIVFIKPIQETYYEGKKVKQQILGSGVIIDNKGHVVTNHHVAEKSVEIKVVLDNEKEVMAEVVGLDKDTDLAVLKLVMPEDELPKTFAEFGDSDALEEGDFVMTMGCPLGLQRSISFGIISNTSRYLGSNSLYNLWLQTDASINPGNSGGPLVNIEGKIVGINTLGATWADNIGFSNPSSVVKYVVDELIKNKFVDRAWTGIQFQALKDFQTSTFIDQENGVLVKGFEPFSPSEESDLKEGDLILSVNGQKVNGRYIEDLPIVRSFFAKLPKNVPATLAILRDKNNMTVELTPISKGNVEGMDYDMEEWMCTIKEINKFNDPNVHYFKKTGCFVQGVKEPGNASISGMTHGDIFVKVGHKEINSLEDLKKVEKDLLKLPKSKRKVLVHVIRQGLPAQFVLDFSKSKKEYEEEE